MVATKNEFGIAKMTINEEIIGGTDNDDLHVHENDVIEVESSDDETIFNGNDYILDDTLDDLLSIFNIKRKERDQVFVFSHKNIYRLIDEDDEDEDDIFG
ncbi:hypothetical protein Tco_0895669 [Tanacetum coccineum]|uniref:Uncharacterized protein n=1 Tax=Tanacetum coccineum TaxID=301880 RepID=A0ABQ5CGR7_9ASTR